MPTETYIQSIEADKENRKLFPDPQVIRSQDAPQNLPFRNKIFETRDLRGSFENRFLFPVTKGGIVTLLSSTDIGAYSFPDNSGNQSIHFTTNLPKYKKISTIEMVWSTTATSGNGNFQVDISYARDGETNAANTTGGTAFTVAAKSSASQLNYTDLIKAGITTGINLGRLRPNDTLGIKVSRLSSAANDTLTATVLIYGIIITYNNF